MTFSSSLSSQKDCPTPLITKTASRNQAEACYGRGLRYESGRCNHSKRQTVFSLIQQHLVGDNCYQLITRWSLCQRVIFTTIPYPGLKTSSVLQAFAKDSANTRKLLTNLHRDDAGAANAGASDQHTRMLLNHSSDDGRAPA